MSQIVAQHTQCAIWNILIGTLISHNLMTTDTTGEVNNTD